ncbi:sigma-70 family RNA polymerase sigma factor [Nocardioides sp. P5_C9_2]
MVAVSLVPAPHDRRSPAAELVEAHLGVARAIASRYRNRGVSLEDLEQVACLGLVKAARRFDPDEGHDFLAFAVPTIRGEVRRHFRDACWMVRPPRRVQELQARIATAESELALTLGHLPTPAQLAAHLDEAESSVIEALAADGCFVAASLDAPLQDETSSLLDLLVVTDVGQSLVEARLVLGPLVRALDARDRQILVMRFFEDRTQGEIAAAVGVTQSQVSRTLTRILDTLRTGLAGRSPAA